MGGGGGNCNPSENSPDGRCVSFGDAADHSEAAPWIHKQKLDRPTRKAAVAKSGTEIALSFCLATAMAASSGSLLQFWKDLNLQLVQVSDTGYSLC